MIIRELIQKLTELQAYYGDYIDVAKYTPAYLDETTSIKETKVETFDNHSEYWGGTKPDPIIILE